MVSGGGHFQDHPILPELHDFSDLSLSCLVKFGFAALDPLFRGRSHIRKFRILCLIIVSERVRDSTKANRTIYKCNY